MAISNLVHVELLYICMVGKEQESDYFLQYREPVWPCTFSLVYFSFLDYNVCWLVQAVYIAQPDLFTLVKTI